jgi:fermentation-respiration switch protein FrsA (DUF1100 family)
VTRSLLIAAAAVLAAYFALVAFVYLTQSQRLYFPLRELDTTPAAYGMDYHDVSLATADGVRLHGWYVPAPAPRGVLLFFHGNAGNISHRLDSIRIFRELGLSVFIIDYRGYGRSEGRPDEAGLYRDAQAAWRYLREEEGVAAGRIVVFGRSLGAAVAAWLAAREAPAALIVESAFTSAPDLAAELFPWLPVRHLLRFEYDTRRALAQLRAPLLVAHSRDDEIVPFAHAQRLLEAAGEPKALLEMRGGHNDGFLRSQPEYAAGLGRFLDQVLAGMTRPG